MKKLWRECLANLILKAFAAFETCRSLLAALLIDPICLLVMGELGPKVGPLVDPINKIVNGCWGQSC